MPLSANRSLLLVIWACYADESGAAEGQTKTAFPILFKKDRKCGLGGGSSVGAGSHQYFRRHQSYLVAVRLNHQ